MIRLKRAYEKPAKNDGRRVLVDRVWPRGVSRDGAQIDEWMKQVAPSAELRKWFDHEPAKWEEFRERYWRELEEHGDAVERLRQWCDGHRLTLVYGAKDEEHNNAVALKQYLEGSRP